MIPWVRTKGGHNKLVKPEVSLFPAAVLSFTPSFLQIPPSRAGRTVGMAGRIRPGEGGWREEMGRLVTNLAWEGVASVKKFLEDHVEQHRDDRDYGLHPALVDVVGDLLD